MALLRPGQPKIVLLLGIRQGTIGANLVRQSILALNVTNIPHSEIALQDAVPATCSAKIESGNGPTLDDAMARSM